MVCQFGGYRAGTLLLFSLSGIALCGGCGDDAADGARDPGGQVADPWRSYCVATFTRDYRIADMFGDPVFTAREGDAYLMTEFGESFGKDRAGLAYLAADGPFEITIEVEAGTQSFPFTTNCTFGTVAKYYAVFTDVSVYDSEELTTKLCDLSAGTVVPLDGSTMAGYSTSDFGLGGPATYEIMLNAFAAQCGGASTGYVDVPQTKLFGATTWLVPITAIIGPQS